MYFPRAPNTKTKKVQLSSSKKKTTAYLLSLGFWIPRVSLLPTNVSVFPPLTRLRSSRDLILENSVKGELSTTQLRRVKSAA